jgi:CubicO group peptidase (beta-lactamase class C family)
MQQSRFDAAAEVLDATVSSGQVRTASIYVWQREREFAKAFGEAKSPDAIFLLASISKPISAAALMTLFDLGQFRLDDPVSKFVPEFTGEGRDRISIEQLLTHTSGLPDQLPENEALRKSHAPLSEFVAKAIRTQLLYEPGSQYRYSSMGILLASEVARRISGTEFKTLVAESILRPLGMKRSALGLGDFQRDQTMQCQVENASPESGGGDPNAADWNWNSNYWRALGSPWGGMHASAPDVAKFFAEFLRAEGKTLKPDTARLMIRNHNREGLIPRGLSFALGAKSSSSRCSPQTFSHSGATGTIAWADPATETICVVLTTLPENAARPHPMRTASDKVAEAVA